MNLAGLLFALRPLLDDPDANWAQIVELLERHQSLAEYEVARFLVTRKIHPGVAKLLGDVDPRVRLRGLTMVALTYSRKGAGHALRHLVKDPDNRVRARAQRIVRQMRLDDVALPDLHAHPQGPWNPWGWRFGLVPARRRRPAAPTRMALTDKLDLPDLLTADDVAALVGLPDAGELVPFTRPGVAAGSGYVEFEVPKATGGMRRIAAPRAPLRKIQRKILDDILAKLPVHAACHGFVPGRSIVTNAAPHQRAALVLKMDLRDFFPTVHYRRVAGMFTGMGYNDEVARTLAGLCTYRPVLADKTVVWPGVLPQGAPTSPALANHACRRLDARLAGLCTKVGAAYTRYADDLTFSFATPPDTVNVGRFIWWIDQICQQEGFAGNEHKRRVLRQSNQQRVAGIVVNSGLFVPREARRRFRAILHNCRAHGVASQARGRADFTAYLQGFAAYVKMVQPDLGAELIAEVEALLAAPPKVGAE